MSSPVPAIVPAAVPIEHQVAELAATLDERRAEYAAAVSEGTLPAEVARRRYDALACALDTLLATEAALAPVLRAMGFAFEDATGEATEGSAEEPPQEPPPSDGLEGTEPIAPDQVEDLRALIAEHGWEDDQVVELLARSGWRRLSEIPVRKLGLVRSAIADAMHRAQIAEALRARSRRADRERRAAAA